MTDASLEPPRAGFDLPRRLVAEALGTALLLAIVVGSGIMGERLAGGNVAVALLADTLATGTGLVVLITILGPLSGAHVNPAVTLVFALRGELPSRHVPPYIAAQAGGAVLGVWAAHLMFEEPVLQLSTTLRDGPDQAFSEGVATFGLVAAILGALRFRRGATPAVVGLFIASAYWLTASTSFANPAVTLARALSDSFAGIAPSSVLPFIFAQLAGGALAAGLCGWLFRPGSPHDRHHLAQPRLRHLPQHARHDPGERRGSGRHRLPPRSPDPRPAPRADRRRRPVLARGDPREGYPLRGAGPRRPVPHRRPAPRRNSGAPDPDQPPLRGNAQGRPPRPPSKRVLEILPNSDIGEFRKEDGEVVRPPLPGRG